MALVSLDLAWEEEARVTTTGSERIVWYKAVCSSVFDADREILLGALNFPQSPIVPFMPDPKNPARLVQECYPKRIPGSAVFDIQVTYSTDVSVSNPLNQPAEITITGQRRDVVALFDANGTPKCNTAGDLIGDPAPTRMVTDLIFSVSKNVSLKLPAFLTQYLDAVNSDSVRIRGLTLDVGTLLFCGEIKVGPEQNSGPQQGNGIQQPPYTTVEFELHYRADGWTTLVPNRGFFELVPNPKAVLGPPLLPGDVPIKVGKDGKVPKFPYVRQRITVGNPPDYPAEPQFLDLNGAAISNPTPDDIVVLEFDDFAKLPFNALPGVGRP